MIYEIKPGDNDSPELKGNKMTVFLAGSIEQGSAEKWASLVVQEMRKSDNIKLDIVFYNPRRDDWDSSWEQKESNNQFNSQVNWELNRLEECDIIFMYLSPETKSPISLLELGKFAGRKQMVVCCPKTFWRRGNVEILCNRENVPLFEDLESAIGALKTKITLYERD